MSSFDRSKSPEIHSHTDLPKSSPTISQEFEERIRNSHSHSSDERSERGSSSPYSDVHSSLRKSPFSEAQSLRKSPYDRHERLDSLKSTDRLECDSNRLLLKEHTSPPNVTVVQPSVTHPMFPYFYPHGYPSSSTSVSLSAYHMLLNQASNAHGLTYLPNSSDLSHLSPTHGLSAFGAIPGHPLYPNLSPTYNNKDTSQSLSQFSGSHLGPLFASRSNNRFTPYSFPMTKTTMATSTSPMSSGYNLGSRSDLGSRSETSPTPSSASLSSLNRSPSMRSRSPSLHTSPTLNPNSELKSIERMLSGLERKREVGPDSTGAIVEK